MKFLELPPNLFRAHLLFQKMSRDPEHYREMREVFTDALGEIGAATAYELEAVAREKLRAEGKDPDDETSLAEYLNAVTDMYFAALTEPEEYDGFINLARKVAKNRELARLVQWENASSREVFERLKEFCDIPLGDRVIPEAEAMGVRVGLINHFISNQLPFIGIAKKYITIRDVYEILKHAVWKPDLSGRIGGKAAGMVLAQRILTPLFHDGDPRFQDRVIVPDTYFIRSEIFDQFVQQNRLERFHTRKYEDREILDQDFPRIKAQIDKAEFSEESLNGFRKILEEIGQEPIILRSSSFLEDNFGLAFSGKYDSVFLTNQGDIQTRLANFITGVKKVHLSTYHPDPILYRKDHNLLDYNEHMSVMVQKVVGRRLGDYFFPLAGGVMYSVNSFAWNPKIDPEAGLMRLVFGLGTRAVDRVGDDYPRLVPLSHPALRPEVDAAAIRKYSQKKVDVLNLKTGQPETLSLIELLRKTKHPESHLALSLIEADHISPIMNPLNPLDPRQACLTFDRLLSQTDFPKLMRDIVQTVAAAYGRPVDMEFAYDNGMIYILQCRTLSTHKGLDEVVIPTSIPKGDIIFTANQILSNRIIRNLEYLVYVDPLSYNRINDYERKLRVAKAVNAVNEALAEKRFGLFGPGRWGSRDVNLGVQVRYHDISRSRILGEVAFATDGITPEVSCGTHFFNDLAEADIVPLPLYPDDPSLVFKREFFGDSPSIFTELAPKYADLADVVRVIHIPSVSPGRYLHVYLDSINSTGIGFLGPRKTKDPEN